jgi:thiamine pyrophosphate-dependent acetolactate synthase large subunit-like protein
MRVYEGIADELVRRNCKAVFSLAASETVRIIAAAAERGIPNYSTRHEQAAVGMADGYHRASGEVGVVIVGRGPGLTNGVNALINATKGRSGVLVVAGELPNAYAADPAKAHRQLMGPKTINQRAFLESIDVLTLTLSSGETAVADFGAAYEIAASGRTVAVLIRADVVSAEAGERPSEIDVPLPEPPTQRASQEDVEFIADLLGETWAVKRPLIIAGRGAVKAGARDELLRLAERTGALLATSLLGRPLFAGDPYCLGLSGTMATPVATEFIMESDLVLVFGASLNLFTTFGGELLQNARVIQVDIDPEELGAYHPVDLGIAADARVAAAQIVQELDKRGHSVDGLRTPEVAEKIAAEDLDDLVHDEGTPGALDPRRVLIEFNRILPNERAVVVDGGAVLAWIAQYLTASDPKAFFFPNDYFTLAAGIFATPGVAVAHPERLTVLGLGDGGFMMSVNDLDTAVRYRLPIVYLVLNDNAFGQEVHQLRAAGLAGDVACYDNPSFVEVARAMGAQAIRLESLGDLEKVKPLLDGLEGPLVIDCPISREVYPDATDFVERYGHRAAAEAVVPTG